MVTRGTLGFRGASPRAPPLGGRPLPWATVAVPLKGPQLDVLRRLAGLWRGVALGSALAWLGWLLKASLG